MRPIIRRRQDLCRRPGHERPSVETRVVDARQLDPEPDSFDAAIFEAGADAYPGARASARRHPSGVEAGEKFAALVLATADESPLIALPMAIAARRAGPPQAPFDDPGLFALGDPAVLAAAYRDAGFSRSPSRRRRSYGGTPRSRWRCKPSGICFQRSISC
jgi:hypothetical protein